MNAYPDLVIPGYIPYKNVYLCWWKDMNLNVYRSSTHNNTELETTQMSITEIVVYFYHYAAMRITSL